MQRGTIGIVLRREVTMTNSPPPQRPGIATVAELREQAMILRGLAETFDIVGIRSQLLALARQCEALAASMEENAAPPSA